MFSESKIFTGGKVLHYHSPLKEMETTQSIYFHNVQQENIGLSPLKISFITCQMGQSAMHNCFPSGAVPWLRGVRMSGRVGQLKN